MSATDNSAVIARLEAQRDEMAKAASNLVYTAKRMWEDKTGFQYSEGEGGVTHPMIEDVISTLANLDSEPTEQPAVTSEGVRLQFEATTKIPHDAFYNNRFGVYRYILHPGVDHPVDELWGAFCDGYTAAAKLPAEQPAVTYADLNDAFEAGVAEGQKHQPAVPEEWKLVPIKPTEQMKEVAADNLCSMFGAMMVDGNERFAVAAYQELVEAAPQPPAERWIPCSERLPEQSDRDWMGEVIWHLPKHLVKVVREVWCAPNCVREATHWKPTGLKRPEPPQQGGRE